MSGRIERLRATIAREGFSGAFHGAGIILKRRLGVRQRLKHARSASLRLVEEVRRSKQNGLYIDLGSNVGQGFEFFSRFFPWSYFDAVLVEPNPNCAKILRANYPDVQLIEAAASTSEGTMKLYGLTEDSRGATTEGASIVKGHSGIFYTSDESTAITVPTFDFSKFLFEKAARYNVIVVKMDIESAEYDVLPHIIRTGAIKHISDIFIEFHSHYMAHNERDRYAAIERQIKHDLRAHGIPFALWR